MKYLRTMFTYTHKQENLNPLDGHEPMKNREKNLIGLEKG